MAQCPPLKYAIDYKFSLSSCSPAIMLRKFQESGSRKRKATKEKQEKVDAVLAKTCRIGTFFEKVSTSTCTSSADDLNSNQIPDDNFANEPFSPFLMINNEPDPDDKNYNHSITFTDIDHIVTYEESDPMGSNITQFVELVQPDTDTASKSSITVDVADTCRERDACSKYVNEISKSTDPADWFPIRSETVDFWINKETNLCQNKSETDGYKSSKRFFNPTKKDRMVIIDISITHCFMQKSKWGIACKKMVTL